MFPIDTELLRQADDYSYLIWLYSLPTWAFALLTISAFTVITLIGLRLFHRRINDSAFATLIDNGTVGWFFSGITVLYGLLLGLLAVGTWNNFNTASSLASQEAAALGVLYRDLSGLPQPQQKELENQLFLYTTYIVNQSWPSQRKGMIDDGETQEINRFVSQLFTIQPTSEIQKILLSEAIHAFNSVTEFRRLRAAAISGSVPTVIWDVVLAGAVFTIFSSYFFSMKDYWHHAALSGLLAAMIGLLVFLISALDHPYWGGVSVSSVPYQIVIEKVMKEHH